MNEGWWRDPEELDEDQQEVVALAPGGHHLVIGPPGSGKTNLLLLRAAYLTRAGYKNIAIITYTRVLKEFLSTGAAHYPFESGRIQTYRSWGLSVLKEHGIAFDASGAFDNVQRAINENLSAVVQNAGASSKLDCILIDEVQDYTVEEIRLMSGLAENVFAVGDDNQRIYKASGSIDFLETLCGGVNRLEFHYRNGHAICRLADGVMNMTDGGMGETCNYDERRYPSTVNRNSYASINEQISSAVDLLETQSIAYPGEWIGVLAPRKVDVQTVFEGLKNSRIGSLVQLQKYDDGYSELDSSKPIVITTMHSAKGLEFRAVHLMALDKITTLDHHQKLAFTAITRAKTSLNLYHSSSLAGYLERGLTAVVGEPKKRPTLAELFGSTS